jgi:Co/Zn/Cd efflux system component
VAAVLFGLITAVQFVAALAANSMALLADCVCMAVDTLSYVGNIVAECAGEVDPADAVAVLRQGRQRVGAAGASLGLLLGFTIYFMAEALVTIVGGEGDGEDVDPYIVLGFALAGLLFDAVSLAAFRCWHQRTKVAGGGGGQLVGAAGDSGGGGAGGGAEGVAAVGVEAADKR